MKFITFITYRATRYAVIYYERKEQYNMKTKENKWLRAAVPALLLHCSIGTVYCWSIFSQEIADYIGFSKGATEWAFSFAIFFLGMSAAFLGNVVEKDIHKSSLIAAVCFALGMAGTGFFIWYGGQHTHSPLALIGIYVSYGFIMGIGSGHRLSVARQDADALV